ncbi:hypothetical protein [Stenotrophomonas sp. PS02298]|uniref:hypothetical protein n=1 Tax=Stenotrophomonas sp. PS02298 TaxID=2991424 RepID=UPI00249A0585|nr:hypothetical protein [Stenotrophomonas sp. PS02298]
MAEGMAPALEMGFREFATRMGWRPSYITQLKKEGRLVLTADGRRVLVNESIERIAATRDPSRAGVRERHAAGRDVPLAAAMPASTEATSEPGAGSLSIDELAEDADLALNSPHQLRRAKALADKEEALARKTLREEAIEMGQLLVKDEVLSTIADSIVQLRSSLELLPPTLAPALAALDDEDEVRVMLRDAIEKALETLSRKLSSVGRAEA